MTDSTPLRAEKQANEKVAPNSDVCGHLWGEHGKTLTATEAFDYRLCLICGKREYKRQSAPLGACRVTPSKVAFVCEECGGRGEVPATPGQPGDGPMPCPRCERGRNRGRRER